MPNNSFKKEILCVNNDDKTRNTLFIGSHDYLSESKKERNLSLLWPDAPKNILNDKK